MTNDTVRIGVIGTGFGAAVHVPGFLKTSGIRVQGIWGRDTARAEDVRRKFGIAQAFSSLEEMVRSPDIDAVSITAPQIVHEEIALEALRHGKHVLCEKPLAMDSAGARRMLEAAERAGVVHMTDFEFAEIAAWRSLKNRLEAGDIGAIRHVHIRWSVGSWADRGRLWGWQCDEKQGGGVMRALGVHALHYIEWLFGPIARLAVAKGVAIRERPDASGALRPVTAEDHCHVLFEMGAGFPVTFSVSNVAPRGAGHFVEVYDDSVTLLLGSDHIRDYGKGFKVFEGRTGSLELTECGTGGTDEGDAEGADCGLILPFSRIAQRFRDAITTGGRDVHPSFREGLRTQILLDAVDRSDKERIWLDIPSLDK